MLQDIQKYGHSVCVENMKKEVRRPRHVREENFKNRLEKRVCKNWIRLCA